MVRRQLTRITASIILFALAGCGGGGGSTDNTVVATAQPAATIAVPVGSSQAVTVEFATSDGANATGFQLAGFASLPPGWSAPISALTCPSVAGGSGCTLDLTYKPTGVDLGAFTLDYQYTANNGTAKTGIFTINYAATSHNSVLATISPNASLIVPIGATQDMNVSFTTDDGNAASSLTVQTGSTLPPGWTLNDSSSNCATVTGFPSCLLTLSYAPTRAASGDINIPYSYSDDSGAAKTGQIQIRYQAVDAALRLIAGSVSGSNDGPAATARFNHPQGLALDSTGTLFVADASSVRKIAPNGLVTTLADVGVESGLLWGAALDSQGNVFTTTQAATILEVTPAGNVVPVTGVPDVYTSSDGLAAVATFNGPTGIVSNGQGGFLIADDTIPRLAQFLYVGTIRELSSTGVVTTIAGDGISTTGDGPAYSAGFSNPTGIARDADGNVFIADWGNGAIREISRDGTVSTLASSADGFHSPSGIALDGLGNIYVTDSGDNTVRMIDPMRNVSIVAGVSGKTGNTNGPASTALFNFGGDNTTLTGIAIDQAGNIFVADTGNGEIREITQGNVSTYAGQPTGQSGGSGATAFLAAQHLTADNLGNLYVSDTCVVYKITSTGNVAFFPGIAAAGTCPGGIKIDANGNLYTAYQSADTIQKIDPAGSISTIAGVSGQSGAVDGSVLVDPGSFDGTNIALDAVGNVYVTSSDNTIHKITPTGTATILAGATMLVGASNGSGPQAQFNNPQGIALDATGNMYVADSNNNLIRRIGPDGTVSTIAGTPGAVGSADGPAAGATFDDPTGVATDAAGNIYISDQRNYTIRKIDTSGRVSTLAGSPGNSAEQDGQGSAARFLSPTSIAAAADGSVYVADTDTVNNQVFIRLISSAAVVRTLTVVANLAFGGLAVDRLGNLYAAFDFSVVAISASGLVSVIATPVFGAGLTVDAAGNFYLSGSNSITTVTPNGQVGGLNILPATVPPQPLFNSPSDLALDGAGNVYVADTANDVIRKITPSRVVTTLAGAPTQAGSGDGTGSAARFRSPQSIVSDGSGTLYVADQGNQTIRKITGDGTVTTLAGSPGYPGFADGPGRMAKFNSPSGLALDGGGTLYVADQGNSAVRAIAPDGTVTTVLARSGAGKPALRGVLPSNIGPVNAVAVLPNNKLAVVSQTALFETTQ